MATVPKSLRLASEIDARLSRLAQQKDRAPQHLMREAIAEYLEREEKRQAFTSDGRAAWDNFQRTGEHLTMAQFSTMIRKLKARKSAKKTAR